MVYHRILNSLLLPQGQNPADTSTTGAGTASRLVFWVFVCFCTFILFIGHEVLVARVRVQLMSTSALKRDVWAQDRGRGRGAGLASGRTACVPGMSPACPHWPCAGRTLRPFSSSTDCDLPVSRLFGV